MTEYHPLPRYSKQRWLLTDETIIEEPPLEQSAEGRRARVMGSTKSVYMKDVDDLIFRSVSQAATDKGEHLWMRVTDNDPVRALDVHTGIAKPADEPHFLAPKTGNTRYYGRSSELSWTFRHPHLPIAARITISMREAPRGGNKQTVTTTLDHPSTNRYDAQEAAWFTSVQEISGFGFAQRSFVAKSEEQAFEDWLRKTAPEWTEILGQQEYENEREAAAGIAKLCRKVESYDTISIPDLRDPNHPSWIELQLHDTTYSRDFVTSLVDFINGQPVAEELAELWSRMVETFRRAGLVVDSLEESDFHSAIQGNAERVNVNTKNINGPEGLDESHYIGFNLATGTITVSCSVRDTRPDSVSTEYEIARIRAETRGELDAFLGHQAGFLEQHHEQRHRKTVEQRSVEVDDGLDELLNLK